MYENVLPLISMVVEDISKVDNDNSLVPFIHSHTPDNVLYCLIPVIVLWYILNKATCLSPKIFSPIIFVSKYSLLKISKGNL